MSSMLDNSNNCSSTDQISRLNRELCLWTGSSASCHQWLWSGSSGSSQKVVCSVPEDTWRSNRWHVITDVSWIDWIVFFYLNLILMSSLFMNWAFVLFPLWQKAVTKLAGTFLWLHCINRGPSREWDGTSQRSGLFRVCGNGWSEWLLACLGTARNWCWLPLSNAGDELTATWSEVGDRAAFLVSDWVSACFHLRAVKWNKSLFTCWFLYLAHMHVNMLKTLTPRLQVCMGVGLVHSVLKQVQDQVQLCCFGNASEGQRLG